MADKLIGKVLGDFRLEELIGRGSVGKVYRASQISLNRPVAIKVLEEGLFTLEDLKQRFLREAAFIAKLEHPNIVPVYAAGQQENFYFFAMRLVEGKTLGQRMLDGLPLREGLRFLADACGGLAYAHARGILHRDIKPANIMIADNAAVLADFGLARLLDTTTITTSGAFIGTPLYFSPEQARRERATAKSDLFAVGIILYEMAAGRHPFAPVEKPAPSREELIDAISAGRFDSPRAAAPAIPDRLEQIILRALRVDPEERYGSAREFQRDLQAVAALPELGPVETEVTDALTESDTGLLMMLAASGQFRGKQPTPRPALQSFGKYLLHEPLGHGGMGIVYRAEQPELRRMVALKVLTENRDDDGKAVERFRREAQAAGRLRHMNIVPIHDIGEVDGKHYFTMDLIDGQDLDHHIDRGPLPPKRAIEILRDAARAVHHAHGEHIIHRDLKPGNILLDRAGRVYVTDFGLAKDLKEEASKLTRSGDVMGTPSYMSPEQARGATEEIDARSDVYALGAVLYHAMTGCLPFTGESVMQVLLGVMQGDPIPPRRLNPKIHIDAETICLKAMERERERRYASALEFAEECERFLRGEPIQARPVTALERLLRRAKRQPLAVALVVAIMVILLIAGFWLARILRVRSEVADLRPRAREAYDQKRYAEAARIYAQIEALDAADEEARARARECADTDAALRETQRKVEERMGAIYSLPYSGRADAWTEIIALDPGRVGSWRERGLVLRYLRRYEDARRDFKKAIELDPGDAFAHWGLGTIYRDVDKDKERALEEFRTSTRLDPKGWAGLYGTSLLLWERGDHVGFVAVMTDVIKLQPELAIAYHDRAVAYIAMGESEKALADAGVVVRLDARYASAHAIIATAQWQLGRPKEAEASAEKAILLDPLLPQGWEARGLARQAVRRYEEALADFDKAQSLDVEKAHPLARKARVRLLLGRLAEAKADIDAALKHDPDSWEALIELANWHLANGQYPEAERVAKQVLPVRPDARDALAALASACEHMNRLPEAIEYYTKALAKDPRAWFVLINRAGAYHKMKELDKALEDYRRASELPEDDGTAHFGIGLVHKERKEWDAAIEVYLESVKRGHVRSYYSLGICYDRKHDLKSAKAAFEKTVDLDPDPGRREKARRALEEIRKILERKT